MQRFQSASSTLPTNRWFQAALPLKMGHAIIAKECQGTLLEIFDISISLSFGCFASCSSNCSFQAALASLARHTTFKQPMLDACQTIIPSEISPLSFWSSSSLVSFSNVVLPIDLRVAGLAGMTESVQMSNNWATLTVMQCYDNSWQLQPPRWEWALMENPGLPSCLALGSDRWHQENRHLRRWRGGGGHMGGFSVTSSVESSLLAGTAAELTTAAELQGTPDITEVAPSLPAERAKYYGLAKMYNLKKQNWSKTAITIPKP